MNQYLKVLCLLAAIFVSEIGVCADEVVSFSDQQLKGDLDGIPMHYINVQTRSHADVDINLDGKVTESIWREVPAFDNMLVSVPGTGEKGEFPTETRMLATEKGLYVSGVMFQPPETIVRRITKRDEHTDRDTFGFTLDTTGNGAFAYWFVVGLGDSVMDGKVLPVRRYSSDWDGPWLYKTAEFDQGWSVEIFFPWSMMDIQEKEGPRDIGFAVSRQVSHANHRYYWPGHSYSSPQFVTALNTMRVEGVEPRQQISVIPYISATQDRAADDDEVRAGFDLTWRPSTKAELTASLNPDFGAVEADNVVLNLTALETFFPEKRLFFLEGNEVFVTTPRANSGNSLRELTNENFATTSRRVFVSDFVPAPISLLNTRRIGGTASQVVVPAGVAVNPGQRDLPTDLLGAIKLKGQAGNLRYGLFGAFEDEVEWLGTDATGDPYKVDADGRDFAIVRLSHEKSGRNRYALGYLGTYVSGPVYDAKVHGVDWHYSTGDGKWNAAVQLMHSDVDGVSGQGGLLDLTYGASSAIQHKIELDYFDEQVNINDLGFLRRNDYGSLQYNFRYAWAKTDGRIRGFRGAITARQQYNISEGLLVDSGIYWRNKMELPGRNTVHTALAWLPKRYEDVDSRGNGTYRVDDRIWWNLLWATDAGRMFTWSFGVGGLQENLGDWTGILSAGVTVRPSSNLVLELDVKYKRRDGWLVYQGDRNFGAFNGIEWQPGIELNWFMAPRHELRFSLQWVGVRMDEQGFYETPAEAGSLLPVVPTRDHDFTVSMLTTQLRYRWEIAPLTDLYVVYNRGNRLPFRNEDEFSDLFSDTLDEPLVDSLVIKLRYRFGN